VKPLLDRKVTRGTVINEWDSGSHHLTHDGQVEFMARMQARIKAAQSKPVAPNVSAIQPRKERKA
jgi:hypothetical protein